MEYKQVHAALCEYDTAHAAVMAGFRAQVRPGDYRARWNRSDRCAMARAITAVEDALELRGAPAKTRLALRSVRRALEDMDLDGPRQEVPYAVVLRAVIDALTPRQRARDQRSDDDGDEQTEEVA